MKISKLFHWLYALIMFLPVFFWIPTAFYYGFNEHATNPSTTDVQINYKYQSNEVHSVNDLVEGNIYHAEQLFFEITDNGEVNAYVYILACDDYSGSFGYGDELVISYYNSNNDNYITFNYYDDGGCSLILTNENAYAYFDTDSDTTFYDVVFIYNHTLYPLLNVQPIESLVQYTDYNVIESVNVVESGGISNAMNQSWQDVWSLPMFSWTHDTFFSAPFNYIAGLFGIQAGNTLSYCLSYWFSISIIWLVFDLMIYVPLLVHRWLDKAGIQ